MHRAIPDQSNPNFWEQDSGISNFLKDCLSDSNVLPCVRITALQHSQRESLLNISCMNDWGTPAELNTMSPVGL